MKQIIGFTYTEEYLPTPRCRKFRERENHYALLVYNCEISYVSNSQDKHNASFEF